MFPFTIIEIYMGSELFPISIVSFKGKKDISLKSQYRRIFPLKIQYAVNQFHDETILTFDLD